MSLHRVSYRGASHQGSTQTGAGEVSREKKREDTTNVRSDEGAPTPSSSIKEGALQELHHNQKRCVVAQGSQALPTADGLTVESLAQRARRQVTA